MCAFTSIPPKNQLQKPNYTDRTRLTHDVIKKQNIINS